VPPPAKKKRKRPDAEGQLVFRFACDVQVENERLRAENQRLKLLEKIILELADRIRPDDEQPAV
jgi:hypothetical protein